MDRHRLAPDAPRLSVATELAEPQYAGEAVGVKLK